MILLQIAAHQTQPLICVIVLEAWDCTHGLSEHTLFSVLMFLPLFRQHSLQLNTFVWWISFAVITRIAFFTDTFTSWTVVTVRCWASYSPLFKLKLPPLSDFLFPKGHASTRWDACKAVLQFFLITGLSFLFFCLSGASLLQCVYMMMIITHKVSATIFHFIIMTQSGDHAVLMSYCSSHHQASTFPRPRE